MTILKIIFWLLLLDSLIANYIAWSKSKDFYNKMKFFKRFMPLTKGWTVWYLVLVLIIGWATYLH